ncbi:MAG: Glyceraldehyde-3-phosphate dehydrogenase [Euryarchaeota archaeon ADurb.Bin190]|nr:glyceraldehyde-3-phosphate dehydrogenase [Methanothrix sp.]OQB26674.1 MAG: Glyceraldehyde-3-phosphate dehydrogenase [Euryarchaeota archaeon ADurb.Bin190]HNQ54337.1 glyceraldehyde-3-phosphate dehydrogenase [Methanothrix sp.]HNU40273.1 glyceraldehyde-3-phosphate dehydrogenase [Methanothrix sp.]HPA97710.1 glyceraldehyde-3-phosphate dehydrogenase [Methanothrix sp.]
MKSNAGFVGFDGTENKRTLLALAQVKKAAGIDGDLNILLRKPHGRALSIAAKFNRLFGVKAYVSDNATREKWESLGIKIEGGYDDFFKASDFVMVGTPGDQELVYIEAGLSNGCFVSLMGGADRPELLKGLTEGGKVKITDDLKADFAREFFFGLENYEMFARAKPRLVQCTSCNTTGLSRLALAARPLGLTAVLGNIDRRHGDPHTVVRASPSAIQFGKGAGHQGTDAGTVFEEVNFSIRASKVPTTVPHTNFLSLVFKGDVTPAQLVESLAKTREVVVMPYQDEGKKHEWTSEILEAYLSAVERPICPEIFELIVSDAVIPFKLEGYTILQTVSMVEQMSIAVPNHVESYLLSAGYPAAEVHSLVDRTLGIMHGIWPNKLSC